MNSVIQVGGSTRTYILRKDTVAQQRRRELIRQQKLQSEPKETIPPSVDGSDRNRDLKRPRDDDKSQKDQRANDDGFDLLLSFPF